MKLDSLSGAEWLRYKLYRMRDGKLIEFIFLWQSAS